MKRTFCCVTLVFSLLGCANIAQTVDAGTQISQALGYSPKQLNRGVKEALALSITRATDSLSKPGGYNDNLQYQLQFPPEIQKISDILQKFGLSKQLTQVHTLMNRAAEMAAAEAKGVFLQATKNMSITDGLAIVRGGNTAATDYFKSQAETALTARYKTILQNQLKSIGFYTQYQQVLQAYQALPLINKPELDLETYAAKMGVDALFTQVAEEEKRIRANPLEHGSVLLAAIFK